MAPADPVLRRSWDRPPFRCDGSVTHLDRVETQTHPCRRRGNQVPTPGTRDRGNCSTNRCFWQRPGQRADRAVSCESEVLRRSLRSATSVVVVGGGFIGLEIASAARIMGLQVHVIESLPQLMARAVSRPMSEYLLDQHRALGTTIHLASSVTAFTGLDGRVGEVILSNGTAIPADLVLVGIGSEPSVELARHAGLDVADGIVVDHQLRTSDESVFAVGDGAQSPFPGREGLRRLESVQNAESQGRRVALEVLGAGPSGPEVPWFWTEQAGQRLQMVGWIEEHDQVVVRPHAAPSGFSTFLFTHGALVAAESINAERDHVALRRLFSAGGGVSPDQVADPGWDLRDHVRATIRSVRCNASKT